MFCSTALYPHAEIASLLCAYTFLLQVNTLFQPAENRNATVKSGSMEALLQAIQLHAESAAVLESCFGALAPVCYPGALSSRLISALN